MPNGTKPAELTQCDADSIRGLFSDLFNLSNDVTEKARALRLPEADESKPEPETAQVFPDFATEIKQGLQNTLDTLRKARSSLRSFVG